MCIDACRLVLLLVNILVVIAGFILTVIGALLIWGKTFVTEQLNEVIGPWIRQLHGERVANDVSELANNVLRFTSPFGVPIFTIGIFIMLICTFGCCGSCRNNLTCLKIYIAFLLVSVIGQIVCISFYYSDREKISQIAYRYLNDSLFQYQSINANDTSSIIYSVMMPMLNCCGLKSGADFNVSNNFKRSVIYKGKSYNLEYPIPCCKMDMRFRILDTTCPDTFNESNSNYNIGCWYKLQRFLAHYVNVFVLVGIVVIGFQIMLTEQVRVLWTLDRQQEF